jgi:3-dehydroquinate synthase
LEEHAAELLVRDRGVLEYVIARCCRLKADVVERDEREVTGLRAALNYGHTFAHAFETVAGYGTWLHGEAVAAGMICASRLAERLGLIGGDVTDRQRTLLTRFGLPVQPANWPSEQLLAVMHGDKKAVAGRLRFVLPKRLGEVALADSVAEADVRQVLESAVNRDGERPEARP